RCGCWWGSWGAERFGLVGVGEGDDGARSATNGGGLPRSRAAGVAPVHSLALRGRWLPQLDAVPLRIHHPAELSVRFLHDLLVDRRAGGTELGEHCVEVFDAEIDHEGGL